MRSKLYRRSIESALSSGHGTVAPAYQHLPTSRRHEQGLVPGRFSVRAGRFHYDRRSVYEGRWYILPTDVWLDGAYLPMGESIFLLKLPIMPPCPELANNSRLLLWPGSEIARTCTTRVRTATAKVPYQVDTLLNCSIKNERCLTSRLLHCKREVTFRIDGSFERIGCLGRRPDHKSSAQSGIPLALP